MDKDTYLGFRAPIIESFDLPGAPHGPGGKGYIRVLTCGDRDLLDVAIVGTDGKQRDLTNYRAKAIVLCLCDADGRRIFSEHEHLEVGKINNVLATAIHDAAKRINGLSQSDVEARGKDSGLVQSEDSNLG